MSARPVTRWPLAVIALPAAVAIWAGWVGLGQMAGFGKIHPLPGTPWAEWTLDTAITLPVGVEAYAAYALRVWLGAPVRLARTRAVRFARASAVASLALGMAGQVAYHLLQAAHVRTAPWQITTLVACLPVAVLGMGATLAHLIASAYAGGEEAHAGAREPARTPETPVREEAYAQVSGPYAAHAAEASAAPAEHTQPGPEPVREPVRQERTGARAGQEQRARTRRTVPAYAPDDLDMRRRVRAQWVARTEAERRTPTRALARTLGVSDGAARAQVARWRTEEAREAAGS